MPSIKCLLNFFITFLAFSIFLSTFPSNSGSPSLCFAAKESSPSPTPSTSSETDAGKSDSQTEKDSDAAAKDTAAKEEADDSGKDSSSERDGSNEPKSYVEAGFPEELTESLECSACEIVSQRLSETVDKYTLSYTKKEKAERKRMAKSIVNTTCWTFLNESDFVIDGPPSRRRFYNKNGSMFSINPAINVTKGKSVDQYFHYLCYSLIQRFGRDVESYVSRFYKDRYTVQKTIKSKLCKVACPKKKKNPYEDMLKKLRNRPAVKTTGEDCLLASLKAIGQKKWNRARKKAHCSETNK